VLFVAGVGLTALMILYFTFIPSNLLPEFGAPAPVVAKLPFVYILVATKGSAVTAYSPG
jgi:hypothetical protein